SPVRGERGHASDDLVLAQRIEVRGRISGKLADGGYVRRQHGAATRLRLEYRNAGALIERRKDESGGRPVQQRELSSVQARQDAHVLLQSELADEPLQSGQLLCVAVASENERPSVVRAVTQAPVGSKEALMVLVRV